MYSETAAVGEGSTSCSDVVWPFWPRSPYPALDYREMDFQRAQLSSYSRPSTGKNVIVITSNSDIAGAAQEVHVSGYVYCGLAFKDVTNTLFCPCLP